MFLKRSMVLAAGLVLFIIGFLIRFHLEDAKIQEEFHQERLKFGVEGTVLTASDSGASKTVTSIGGTSPVATPTPAASLPDTNVIIGPLPPSSSTPDSTPSAPDNSAPTPAPASDSNVSPTPTPSSTMLRPGLRHLSSVIFAAYNPFTGTRIQMAPAPSSASPSPSVPPPTAPPVITSATSTNSVTPGPANAEASPTPSPTSTNGASATSSTGDSGAQRPVPIEASVIVLLYHQFTAPGVPSKNPWSMKQDVFEQEMKYLKDNGYHVIPMADLLRFLKHEIGLPPNSVVVTIDDGYKSAIVYAEPILKKYGFPWTYFIYPDFITVNEGKGAASWNDLLALQAEGVDIECHSMTHPTLTKHSQKIKGVWHSLSPDEYDKWLTDETAGAKALLEQKLGKPVTCFAYPYGAYNKEVEAKVVAAGFDAIFTVADNPVHSTTDKFSIGRYTMTQPVEKNFAAYLRQGALSLAAADPAPGATITNPRPVIMAVLGYSGTLDPKSIETDVRDFGTVKHDFDPKTSTLRLYLPRDLIQPVNLVNVRVKDAETGQVMVANWHFNYEPASTAATTAHPPIGGTNAPASAAPSTNTPPASTTSGEASEPTANTPLGAAAVSPH